MPAFDQPLRPLRAALTGRAEAEAAAIRSEAEVKAARIENEAHQRAKEILDDAHAQGDAEARLLLAREKAAARRRERSVELRSRREVYDTLRRRVRESVVDLRDDAALRAALTTHALTALGPAAVVRDDPSGGVVARAPGRCLDLSLSALADRAFDRVAPELEELWTG